MSKIIGVTVGTPTSPDKMKDELQPVLDEATTELRNQVNDLGQAMGQGFRQVNEAVNDLHGRVSDLEQAPGGGGLSDAAKTLLINILRNGLFTSDQSANITALETALTSGGSGGTDAPDIPDEPEIVTYTITYELVNVTSNNSASSVTEGAQYIATLTAADGYELSSVVVTMGGVDVTADVLADGVISIPAVTGSVEIFASATEEPKEAALITDGLLGYFDLRNKPANSGDTSKGLYDVATVGDGRLYSWQNKGEGNEYGSDLKGREFCAGGSYTPYDFGTEFTWMLKLYSNASYTLSFADGYSGPNNMGTNITPKYNTSDDTAYVATTTIPKSVAGYHSVAIVVSGTQLRMYVDSTIVAEHDGSGIEGFVSWYSKFKVGGVYAGTVYAQTAMAFYNRALTEVEIVEMGEYLKTLEVA